MAKRRYMQIRLSEEEEKWIEQLSQDYGIDRSRLVLFSLRYIDEHRPAFVIEPQGKEAALASVVA